MLIGFLSLLLLTEEKDALIQHSRKFRGIKQKTLSVMHNFSSEKGAIQGVFKHNLSVRKETRGLGNHLLYIGVSTLLVLGTLLISVREFATV